MMNKKYFIDEYKGEKCLCFYDEFGDSCYMPMETVANKVTYLEKELSCEKAKSKDFRKALDLLSDMKNYFLFVNENKEFINVELALKMAMECRKGD